MPFGVVTFTLNVGVGVVDIVVSVGIVVSADVTVDVIFGVISGGIFKFTLPTFLPPFEVTIILPV